MESPKTKHRLTPIFLVILISMLFSCAKETKKQPQKIYDIPENMQNAEHLGDNSANPNSQIANSSNVKGNHNLIISGNNTSSFRLGDQVVTPEKTEGYIKIEGNSKKINIASYTGSEGYFFSLYIPAGKNIIGTHLLNKNGNQLILNHKENGLLTVYGSHFCEDNSGKIVIKSYDKSGNTISGSFSTIVCNKGLMGKRGKKTIHICEFNEVKLQSL